MRIQTLRASAVLGAVFAAAVIGLAASAPASAATRVSFGPLIPAPPLNVIATVSNPGTCPIPDSDVHMIVAYPTQWLEAVASQSSHTNARILLDLDSRGDVLQANIVNSSGNSLLDGQALVAARGSKYAPEVRNCNSFRHSYYLDINFDSSTVVLPLGFGGAHGRFAM
jgi:TonB family protein